MTPARPFVVEQTVEQALPRGRTLPTIHGGDLEAEGSAEHRYDPESRFVDEGVLGYGGSAVVRRVLDTVLKRRIALKAFMPSSPGAQARFLAEAQITAQLEHPNIVPIHEYGTDDQGRAFISMKLVSGDTLSERLQRLGARRLETAVLSELVTVVRRVCDALSYAHSRGVTHRDLKPSNIMVGSFGQVYLMDWGIASLGEAVDPVRTTSSVNEAGVSGTPSYMAPEQVEEQPCDARTDVFSVGGVLYTILTGSPPYSGTSTREVLFKALRAEIAPPEEAVDDGVIPPRLSRITMKALSPDPEHRYATVAELQAELDAFQRDAWGLPVRQVAAGDSIVKEGDPGDEAFLIVRGRCQVVRDGHGVVDEIGEGEVFGEMAVLTGRPRDASVVALTDVVVQVVSAQVLEDGLGLDSWTGRFVKSLARRIVEMREAFAGQADDAS